VRRWEYRVISLRDGAYTRALNEYGREGWELVTVTLVPEPAQPETPERTRGVPLPRAIGKLEQAADALQRLEGEPGAEQAHGPRLLWVLRRPLRDEFDFDDAGDEEEVLGDEP